MVARPASGPPFGATSAVSLVTASCCGQGVAVDGLVEECGCGCSGQFGDDRDQVDRLAFGQRGQAAFEQVGPGGAQAGHTCCAQGFRGGSAALAVGLAVLVEEQVAACHAACRAACGALGRAVQRDAGQGRRERRPVVHQQRAAETHGRAAPGGRHQREQDRVTGQVDPSIPRTRAHRTWTASSAGR
jgi:hypothetical protein